MTYRRNKFSLWIFLSITIHFIVAFLPSLDMELKRSTSNDSSVPIKLRLLPLVSELTNQSSLPKTKTGPINMPKSLAKETPLGAERLTSSKVSKITRYSQLLPQIDSDSSGVDLEFRSKPSKSEPHKGYDPENDRIPKDVKMRNLPKLQVFANELAEVIAVPPALQKIEPNGTAQLRINERDGKWEITQAKGDPYFRALLYEAFLKLTPKTNGMIVLGESEFKSVRVNLEFSSVSAVDLGIDPLKIKVNGNNIFIAINYKVADPKWMMLMAGPSALPTVNLLGVAMILAKPYIEPNPRLDFDVRKLQLSPAFSKSIGK